jgi:DNA-binding NarL/FixJ family response regulator
MATRSIGQSSPEAMMALQVVVAEDSPLVQQAVRELLEAAECSVVGQAYDGEEAVRLTDSCKPDVVILDYCMPRLNGVAAARAIRRTQPALPLIMLTLSASEHQIAAAFSAGIRGYVLKADAADDLVRAIHEVTRGATFLSPAASRALCAPYLPGTDPR